MIVFDHVGVGGSTGEVPESISEMADFVAAFAQALGLGSVDVGAGRWVAWWRRRSPCAIRNWCAGWSSSGRLPRKTRLRPTGGGLVDVAVKPTYDLDEIVAPFYTESDNSRAAAAVSEDRIAARQDRQPEIPFDQVMHQANAVFARDGGARKVWKGIQAWLSIRRQDVRRHS